jgi:hypothetical protein
MSLSQKSWFLAVGAYDEQPPNPASQVDASPGQAGLLDVDAAIVVIAVVLDLVVVGVSVVAVEICKAAVLVPAVKAVVPLQWPHSLHTSDA